MKRFFLIINSFWFSSQFMPILYKLSRYSAKLTLFQLDYPDFSPGGNNSRASSPNEMTATLNQDSYMPIRISSWSSSSSSSSTRKSSTASIHHSFDNGEFWTFEHFTDNCVKFIDCLGGLTFFPWNNLVCVPVKWCLCSYLTSRSFVVKFGMSLQRIAIISTPFVII